MASSAQLLALTVLLTVLASEITAFSFRGLARGLKHDSCFTPTSQDDLPPSPGPFDTPTAPFLCFGFQLAATHDTAAIETTLTKLFSNNQNPLLNPYITLGAQAANNPAIYVNRSSPLYYPLDAALGSGFNGTGFNGPAYQKNPITGKFVASFNFQLEDQSDQFIERGRPVNTKLINKVLRNLGNWLQRTFPLRGAKSSRPGITAFQITTWFVRQDSTMNNGTTISLPGVPIFNETTGNFTSTPRLLRQSCKYI